MVTKYSCLNQSGILYPVPYFRAVVLQCTRDCGHVGVIVFTQNGLLNSLLMAWQTCHGIYLHVADFVIKASV
jgi:hypothetical protein